MVVNRCATNKEKEDVVIVLMGSNCRKMEKRVKKVSGINLFSYSVLFSML